MLLAATAVAQDVPAHRQLAARTAALFREHCGREPANAFAAWTRREGVDLRAVFGSDDVAVRLAARAAAVCMLWSDDSEVAFGAACHVVERSLDVADIDRCVAVLRPRLFDEELRFEWDTFKHIVSVRQVAEVLAARPAADSDVRWSYVDDLHRTFRAEHVAALCLALRDRDPAVRHQAFGGLANLSLYQERFRQNIGLDLLGWPGPAVFEGTDAAPYVPRTFALPPAGDGFPPILSAALRRWFIEHAVVDAEGAFAPWLARWARDERPGRDDLPLVVALIGSDVAEARQVGLRAAWQLGAVAGSDPAVVAALRGVAVGAASTRAEVAAALCALGPDAAPRFGDPLLGTLQVALEPHADGPWERFAARALGADAVDGLVALQQLAAMCDEADRGPLLAAEGPATRLRTAIDVLLREVGFDTLGIERAAFLLEEFPECRSHALAAGCLERLTPKVATLPLLAVLELEDPARLLKILTGWRGAEDAAVRAIADAGLAPFAVDESDVTRDALIENLERDHGHGEPIDGLGEIDDPRVRAFLLDLRTRPGVAVQDVIGELAIAGDPAARAEMAEVRARHVYGWMDDARPLVRTEGMRLDLVPYWIDELGTVCCRRNVAATAIEAVLGFDPQQFPERGIRTQRERALAFWERHREHLRFSRIAGYFVVAPHD